MIEQAYLTGEPAGLSVWCQDEAGPYPTRPYPGASWEPTGAPARYDHEYIRNGTAKILTLFHPTTGHVEVKGVESSANAILHPWLREKLDPILATVPEPPPLSPEAQRQRWLRWQAGLAQPLPLPDPLPPLRMLLVWDNLAGHHTPEIVQWLLEHGILPLYTPVGGSWLNMTESMQRILIRRGLSGQHPQSPEDIIKLLEGVAHGWNRHPTPFE